MKRCSDDCVPVCDFCKHYDFNGEAITLEDGTGAIVYVGNGFCRLHNKHAEPYEQCDDFYCEMADAMERC